MDDGRAGPDRAGRASTVRVDRVEGLPAALDGLGVRRGRPVLVLVGGAGGMDDEHLEILRGLLAEAVLPVVDERGAAVVDGGTDSGAMRVIGQARAADDRDFPLVGVAAEGTVDTGGQTPKNPDAAPLDLHHTHFVLVPGSDWGDE
jgi:hypothetical protein